ncbi:alpha/beta hydrolase [Chloroflexota bacterium]|nr:alpha/beta hydrolase [Chloroflexota bacterium]
MKLTRTLPYSTQGDILGTLYRYENFPSQHISPRNVDVWFPNGYANSKDGLPVIYMHDGQNLFDPSLAFGGVDWSVDEVISSLIDANRIPPVIVVGIWNTADRWEEYMPQKPMEQSSIIRTHFREYSSGDPISDHYLNFLVDELKPFIDSTYPSLNDRQHTFIMGSSMGALVSLYALETYPLVFGGAACISTHWLAGMSPLVDSLGENLPTPGKHRFYFDYGTLTLDEGYEPYQQRMDEHLENAGYSRGKDWLTYKFEGAAHDEYSWKKRLYIPLEFLL